MTSKTIIRVKRRLEDDPADALVLSYKKKKIEDELESTVLKFTGTIKSKDDVDATKTVHSFSGAKSVRTSQFKERTREDIQLKTRSDIQNRIKENRFKILSLNRSVEFCSGDNVDSEHVTIVDVDVQSDEAQTIGDETPESKYVYDLYSNEFMTDNDLDDGCIEHILSVQPLYNEMEYRGSEDSDEIDPYEEDSNDEGNWRNDYPDSDHSINDDDMRLAASLYGMGIDNGYDLSGDSDDEHYHDMSGLNPSGSYDDYKARVVKDFNSVHVLDPITDDEDDDDAVSDPASD